MTFGSKWIISCNPHNSTIIKRARQLHNLTVENKTTSGSLPKAHFLNLPNISLEDTRARLQPFMLLTLAPVAERSRFVNIKFVVITANLRLSSTRVTDNQRWHCMLGRDRPARQTRTRTQMRARRHAHGRRGHCMASGIRRA